jgi:hypothetical protein
MISKHSGVEGQKVSKNTKLFIAENQESRGEERATKAVDHGTFSWSDDEVYDDGISITTAGNGHFRR